MLVRLLVSLSLILVPLFAQDKAPIIDYGSRFHPVVGSRGMVSAQEIRAAEIGLEILREGGNAVDAAVAVGYALAVTLPKAGNIGGGGFMLIYLAESDETVALNFREMAPAKAHRDMFLDEKGEVDNRRARFSYLSVGVPGSVAGLSHALEKYGSKPLDQLIAPAIALAEKGVVVTYGMASDLNRRRPRFEACEASTAIFVKQDEWQKGDRLVQKDLAWSLRQIATFGPRAFYEGEIAKRIAADMVDKGGLITTDDLANYKVTESAPVWGDYRGYRIASMPPPSSGGVHVVQMLNILSGYDLAASGHNSAASIHLLAETMKLAYADRSKYLGDPAHYDVPVTGLTSMAYANQLRGNISEEKTKPSSEIAPANPIPFESPQTTHYSVVDAKGNAVAVTTTLNFSFGTGLVASGTGILLNNEMDDFSSKPGTPNAFGLLGGEANAIEPGKRPLSSMTPTMVFKEGKPFLITGSPGGSTIITAVLQTIINVIDHGMNIAEASSVPRVHHQWLPDRLHLERGISADTIRLLEQMGHEVVVGNAVGSTQSIMIVEGLYYGASDPRRHDSGTVAH